ncbi:MAG: hypothetical protein JW782_00600 [Candidatus Saganbacteria bacterium]|nr:hypothetical protein [Candidatus Saganbacteria bacterium]
MILTCVFLALFTGLIKAEEGARFSIQVNGTKLTITAPGSYTASGKRVFKDSAKKLRVKAYYGDLVVKANIIKWDQTSQSLELVDGFEGKFQNYHLTGDYLRINAKTGTFSGYDLKFSYLSAFFFGEEFTFYGDQVEVKNISASPLDFPVFRLFVGEIDMFPGYSLAQKNILKCFELPFYYVPLYVQDSRRNHYQLDFPAPSFNSDIFHGTYGFVSSHYFLNKYHYGDISLGYSDQDGPAGGIKHLYRISDHVQTMAQATVWEKGRVKLRTSGIIQVFDEPKRLRGMTFWQQHELEQETAGIEPKLSLLGDVTINEEIERSIIDRTPDLCFSGTLHGILYNHQYTITPKLEAGHIKEKRIYPESAPAQDVDREYERTRGSVNFTYFLETPQLRLYNIQKALLEVDYEHAVYLPGSQDRGLMETSLTVRRPIFIPVGLFYEASLTKNLLKYGQSPFFFEEYGRLMDSGAVDLYIKNPFMMTGAQYIYDFSRGEPYNEIYYFGLRASDNYFTFQYNRRMGSWELAFTNKEDAF